MSEAFSAIASTAERLREIAANAYRYAQQIVAREKPAVFTVAEFEDDRSLQQLRFYWGVVLAEISDQVVLNGTKWEPEAWHCLLKRKFLGYEITREVVAGDKRTRVLRRLASTPKKVRPMAVYLEQVQAYAVTDLNVKFSERQP